MNLSSKDLSRGVQVILRVPLLKPGTQKGHRKAVSQGRAAVRSLGCQRQGENAGKIRSKPGMSCCCQVLLWPNVQ